MGREGGSASGTPDGEADRLHAEAEVCRQIAWGMGPGAERERLLEEARRCEAALLVLERETRRAAADAP